MTNDALLDQAIAISTRSCLAAAGLEKMPTLPCRATLEIGFFFDGFGHNLEEDLREDRVSNIGRLFLAHPYDQTVPHPDPFFFKEKLYLSGLGAPFDPSLGGGAALTGAGLAAALGKAKDDLAGLPRDTAIDAGLEAGKDLLAGEAWWKRLVNNLKPGKLLAGAATAVATAGTEAVAPIRDHALVAELFKTGVDTRLEAAWERFERRVEEIAQSSEVPLKRLAVSVFGFDFGATLARAFCHKLLAACEPGTTRYKGMQLDFVFVGLFDAVDRSMGQSVVMEHLLPLVNRVEDGECLPGPVKAALHLVAAHECRGNRRARLIGTGALTPRWKERLVPGVSEDVGGGLGPSDAPYSRELALACLHEMYREAYRAGVPFPQLEQLHEVDADVAELFTLNDHLNGISALDASERYLGKVGAQVPSEAAFLAHRRLYIRRLAGLWQLYRGQTRAYQDDEDRLQRPLLGNDSALGRFLGLGGESPQQADARDRALSQTRERRAALTRQLGWLEQVSAEARRLRQGLTRPTEDMLLAEWFAAEPAPVDFAVEDLCEFFLNDRYMIGQMPAGATTTRYFAIRAFDAPDPRKTPGLAPDPLEQVIG